MRKITLSDSHENSPLILALGNHPKEFLQIWLQGNFECPEDYLLSLILHVIIIVYVHSLPASNFVAN
jgi:hypothetical protein